MSHIETSRPALRILIVDDEANLRRTLAISLQADGHEVVAVGNPGDALGEAGRGSFDVAFVDLRLGVDSGMELIPKLRASSPWTDVVVITAHGSIDTAVDAMQRGAADFLTKPFTPMQVRLVTERVADRRMVESRLSQLQRQVDASEPQAHLDSSSASMRRATELARQAASSGATILLRGESGTGKGVLARAIHAWSLRSSGPFTTVSCPSLSAELLESELFGHVKGAFTGAVRENSGRIAATEGGTLFLDEIGDLPLSIQPKLLRFLQDRQFERVGDNVTRKADVRLVCATNIDLQQAVREKRFREDLFYRVNVIAIEIPPLRERPDDILPLAERMLAFYRGAKKVSGFTDDAAAALRAYGWPGNVRELKNAVERAVILSQAERIGAEFIPSAALSGIAASNVSIGDRVPFERIEEAHIRRVLASTNSLEEAADVLDVDAATLWRKRRKYRI